MKCGTREEIAFVDLEYGHVHGSQKRISMPTEVGIALYNKNTNSIEYSGKKIAYDIDVELWRNIIDQYGNKIGVEASVANLKKNEYNKELDKNLTLNAKQKKTAYRTAGKAYRDFRFFVNHILDTKDVDKLVFFGDSRERFAFKRAKISTKGHEWMDLQREIKDEYDMDMLLSLDKVSKAIKFRNKETQIISSNFRYNVPDKYKYLIKPHKALGDSARIFLAYKEFNHDKNNFKKRMNKHLELCNDNLSMMRTKAA